MKSLSHTVFESGRSIKELYAKCLKESNRIECLSNSWSKRNQFWTSTPLFGTTWQKYAWHPSMHCMHIASVLQRIIIIIIWFTIGIYGQLYVGATIVKANKRCKGTSIYDFLPSNLSPLRIWLVHPIFFPYHTLARGRKECLDDQIHMQ